MRNTNLKQYSFNKIMRIHVPSTNLLYIEQLLKEGYQKSDQKSCAITTKSIRVNASKKARKTEYVVLVK